MKVSMIPIIDGALGIVSKGLENRLVELLIKARSETIQNEAEYC